MNYKLCEFYNKYTILSNYEQNTHFIRIAPCFRGSFRCFGMLQVRENEISLRNSSGGPEYLRTLEGILLTRAGLKPMQTTQLHWAPHLWGPRAMLFR